MTASRRIVLLIGLLSLGLGCQPAPAAPTAPPAAKAAGPVATLAEPAKPAAPKAKTLDKVKYGHIPGQAIPVHVAIEKGYFAEQGVEVELVPFTAPNAMIAPLATGELQVAQPSIVPGFFNALARGITLRIVADATHADGNGDEFWVMAGAPNKEKIKDVRDLKGKKIGVTTIPNIQVIQLDKLLGVVGLKLEDVTLEAVGAPDTLPALQSGALDAAHLYGTLVNVAVERGIGFKVANTNRVIPDYQTSIVSFSEEFATQRNDTAKRFMTGYLKAVGDAQDARDKGTNRDQIQDIVARAVQVQPQQVVIQPARRDGRVHLESIIEQMNWYRDHRALEGTPPDVAKFVDYQFVEYAAKQLK